MSTLFDCLPECNWRPDGVHPAGMGDQLRDEALSRLRRWRAALVLRLQRALLSHLLVCGSDTSDAVRALVPIPAGIDPRVVGAAVRRLAEDGLITAVGRRKSGRDVAHGRKLDVWA